MLLFQLVFAKCLAGKPVVSKWLTTLDVSYFVDMLLMLLIIDSGMWHTSLQFLTQLARHWEWHLVCKKLSLQVTIEKPSGFLV